IRSIDYSENFTRAKALMICLTVIPLPGFNDPMKVPFASNWVIENGKWCWHVNPEAQNASPMGPMVPGPPSIGPAPPIPGDDSSLRDMVRSVLSLVQTDRQSVSLKPGESAVINVANTAPGIMNLSVVGSLAGIEAKLGKTSLGANEKTTLTIR